MALIIPTVASAETSSTPSYEIKDVTMDIKVNDKGDMHVTEFFNYNFGQARGILRTINPNKSDCIQNFKAWEVIPENKELDVETIGTSEGSTQYKIYDQSENVSKQFMMELFVGNSPNP